MIRCGTRLLPMVHLRSNALMDSLCFLPPLLFNLKKHDVFFHFSIFSPKWFSSVHFYFSFTMTFEFQQTWHNSWQNIYLDELMQTNVEKKWLRFFVNRCFQWVLIDLCAVCERIAIISPIDAGWGIWHRNNCV